MTKGSSQDKKTFLVLHLKNSNRLSKKAGHLKVVCDYSTNAERMTIRMLRIMRETIKDKTGVDLEIVPKCIHSTDQGSSGES